MASSPAQPWLSAVEVYCTPAHPDSPAYIGRKVVADHQMGLRIHLSGALHGMGKDTQVRFVEAHVIAEYHKIHKRRESGVFQLPMLHFLEPVAEHTYIIMRAQAGELLNGTVNHHRLLGKPVEILPVEPPAEGFKIFATSGPAGRQRCGETVDTQKTLRDLPSAVAVPKQAVVPLICLDPLLRSGIIAVKAGLAIDDRIGQPRIGMKINQSVVKIEPHPLDTFIFH